jgi:hypothetical protein
VLRHEKLEGSFNSNENKKKFCNVRGKFKFRSRVTCFIISSTRKDEYLYTKILYRTLVKCRVIIVGKGDMGLEKFLNSVFTKINKFPSFVEVKYFYK